jgi:tetratricopeptide (TPR) repeat protein
MNNLYLWFASKQERREYVVELLDLRPFRLKLGAFPKSHGENLKKGLERILEGLDLGMTKSHYYRLGEIYSDKEPMLLEPELARWDSKVVFTKGFNRVYTLRSYMKRPGNWLVLQLADTKTGRAMKEMIVNNFPKERLGKNVTPTMMLSLIQLRRVEFLLQDVDFNFTPSDEVLSEAIYCMEEVKKNDPGLFKGKDAYLWEKIAWAFYNYGNLVAAEACFRNQAMFQPSSSEPYLNLGACLSEVGNYKAAVDAYLEGLKINPHDEYIYHNLAKHFMVYGVSDLAMKSINNAILSNPGRAINYKLKAEIHFQQGQYQTAVANYRYAIDLIEKSKDKQWRKSLGVMYLWLARSLRGAELLDEAVLAYKKAIRLNNKEARIEAMEEAANCFIELQEYENAKNIAETILRLKPDNRDALLCLAQCFDSEGNKMMACYYLKKVEEFEGVLD